jgi:hypothetical protein
LINSSQSLPNTEKKVEISEGSAKSPEEEAIDMVDVLLNAGREDLDYPASYVNVASGKVERGEE